MPARKKPSSAADVLRKEMEQPLVLPTQPDNKTEIKPTPDNKPMTSANDDAQLQAAQKEIAELKSKLEHQAKESKDMEKKLKEDLVKLADQNKETAKSPKGSLAIVKKSKGEGRDNPSIVTRPVLTSEETARRRANTDIGWLD